MEILNIKYDFLAYSRIHISIDLNNILVIIIYILPLFLLKCS